MRRRDFLALSATAAVNAQSLPFPIIDTHIHLFDPTRPQGVPWPPKDNVDLYWPATPERYRHLTEPFGIRGAIEVECSPWLEDNQWVLNVAAKDKIIVGTVGNLEPGKPEFGNQLERFHRNSRFRGIRYGNLWDRDLAAQITKAAFISDLKLLSDAGLVLDTANPDARLVRAMIATANAVPDLRIVADHLPQFDCPDDLLRALSQCPNVFVKISQVLRRVDGRVPTDLAFYRARIDRVFEAFGENRVLYGSDWPNCDQWGTYATVFNLVREYFMAKGRPVAEKYFSKNARAVYKV